MSPSSPGAPCHWAVDRGHVRGAALRAGRTHASENSEVASDLTGFINTRAPTRVRAAQPSFDRKTTLLLALTVLELLPADNQFVNLRTVQPAN